VAKAVARPAPQVVRGPAPAARVAKAAPAAPAKVARVTSQSPMRVATVAKPAPQKVVRVAKPAPQKAVRAAPVRVAAQTPQAARKPAPAVATQRSAAKRPATERAGLSRGNVSLIGVFGNENGRHALLLMPDGSVQRVSAGDRVRGTRVAAIEAESVRLTGTGRDTLLRLPD
jgi:hypothetical protein